MIEEMWMYFSKMLSQYPEKFPPRLIDKYLFVNLYSHITTRCFGTGTDSTGIVPMADNLNHNVVTVQFEMMNTDLQEKEGKDKNYDNHQKYLNNYETIFKHLGWKQD